MDSHDAKLASAVLGGATSKAHARPRTRRTTRPKTILYAADGSRLRGLRASVAELILDQQRSAHSEEEVRFFAQEVWQREARESGLALYDPDAERATAAVDVPDATQTTITALPDMFGRRRDGVDAMVRDWGTRKRRRAADEEDDVVVPPLHRWRRVASAASNGVQGWRRVDAMWRESALYASAADALDRGEGDSTWRHELQEVMTRGAPVTSDVASFFSFTEDEFAAVRSTAASTLPDYTTARKLVRLYERYANLVVVADRWSYWSEDGSSPVLDAAATTPTVEQLGGWYAALTRTVLERRLRQLHDALSGAASTPELHPVLTLLRRHPLLPHDSSPHPSRDSSVPRTTDKTTTAWARDVLTPGAWYDTDKERERRARLRGLLQRERGTNVPLQRAATHYDTLRTRATALLQRARAVFVAGEDAASSGESFAVDVDPLPSRCGVKQVVDTSESRAGRKPSRGGGDVVQDTTYHALRHEVQTLVPLTCARLVRVAQAGWMLPGPTPVRRPNVEDDAADDEKESTRVEERAAMAMRYDYDAVQRVNQTGVCNRAFSQLGEAVLLSLPRQAPRLYREVEEELEKYLLEDPYALMEDDATTRALVSEIRVVYAQNLLLHRHLHRTELLCESLRKLVQDVEQATRTAGQ